MADQWLYRVFGQDFGPISFAELRTLADIGIIAQADEVRLESSAQWTTAGSVDELELSNTTNIALAVEPESAAPVESFGPDDWYCQMLGQELGPLRFQELVDYAEQGQIAADDLVRLGVNGKWRRVGSIGRLVAVLPYQELPTPTASRSQELTESNEGNLLEVPEPDQPLTDQIIPSAPSPAVVAELQEAEAALVKADLVCAPMIQAAHHQVSWTSMPTCDPAWWVSINGAIEGPIPFAQVMELAIAGKLRPIDFLCHGRFSQYGPAAMVSGLFQASSLMKTVREALNTAQARVAAAKAAVAAESSLAEPQTTEKLLTTHTSPVALVVKEVIPAPATANVPQKIEEPAKLTRAIEATGVSTKTAPAVAAPAESRLPSAGFGSSPISRPIATLSTAPSRRSTDRASSGTMLETLTAAAKPIGIAAAVLILLAGGWMFLSGGTAGDAQKYYALKEILDEVHTLREKKSTDFSALKKKAVRVGSTTAKTLTRQKSTRPSAQILLRVARDDLPKMIYGDLSVETAAEKKLTKNLSEVATALGLKS